MSKKKNTLNDLQEFLKLQASTLVQPKPVEGAEKISSIQSQTFEQPTHEARAELSHSVESPTPKEAYRSFSQEPFDIASELKSLAAKDRQAFYDAILKASESLPNGTSNVLLINTALYLKNGDNWRRAIAEYWNNRK